MVACAALIAPDHGPASAPPPPVARRAGAAWALHVRGSLEEAHHTHVRGAGRAQLERPREAAAALVAATLALGGVARPHAPRGLRVAGSDAGLWVPEWPR